MRICFSGVDRPKAAAKLLSRAARHLKLADAQATIANACGYRDWHDLERAVANEYRASDARSLEHARDIIVTVASDLCIDPGDVQHALVKSRLLFAKGLSLDDGLSLRTMLWRESLFGPPGRRKAGTIVKVNAPGFKTPAYLKSFGKPSHLIYDTGFRICADFEVVTPRAPLDDFVPSCLWLPYGYWTLADGAIVTFARDYKPMWRIANGRVERLDPWLWISDIVDATHFLTLASTLDWSGGRARDLALLHLTEHRITALPRLVDAMPHLLDPEVESISGAVLKMRADREVLAA
jgi:hypothetical protein